MRSKTSFFNGTIFKKTVTRFWPIWGFYLAVWLVAMPINILANYDDNAASVAARVIFLARELGLAGAFSVSVVSAMAVWSFLYSARSAHGTACLPVRRETLFVSDLLAGLLPLVAANALIALLTGLAELATDSFDGVALWQWFAAVNLELLCFYGIATFCAMLTGNIVVLPLVYVVLNFLTEGVAVLVRQLMRGFVYGYAGSSVDPGVYGSPLVALMGTVTTHNEMEQVSGVWYVATTRLAGWASLLAYAAVGLLLLVAALFLLRRRRMESAGDVVAVPVLKPVFRWCMALGCGLLMGMLFYATFFGMDNIYDLRPGAGFAIILGMLLGAFIGWFAAEMMLKKSFRVFGEKGLRGWGGLGICAAVIVALAVCVSTDIFGLERWTPRAEQVEQVLVGCRGASARYTDPEDVAAAIELHKTLSEKKAEYTTGVRRRAYEKYHAVHCEFFYKLRSGREVTRNYLLTIDLADPATLADVLAAQELVNRPAAVAARKDPGYEISPRTIASLTVSARLPVTRAAALAGYNDPEVFLLERYLGYSAASVAAMEAQRRRDEIEAMFISYGDTYIGVATWEDGPAVSYAEKYDPLSGALSETGELDLEHCYVDYDWSFTPAEAWELYETCLQPDFADGSMGRLWVVTDDTYRESVYDASVRIYVNVPKDDSSGEMGVAAPTPASVNADGSEVRCYATTPTVAAERTVQWLLDHGVELHTLAEVELHSQS